MPTLRLSVLASLLFFGLVATGPLLAEEEAQWKTVGGTDIQVQLPAGYTPTSGVPGFIHKGTKVQIRVLTSLGKLEDLRRVLTPENMKKSGWVLIGQEDLKVAGGEALLVHYDQAAKGHTRRKFSAVFPSTLVGRVTMVEVSYPPESPPELAASLRKIVVTARIDKTVDLTSGQPRPFAVAPVPPLKYVKDVKATKVYVENGIFPTPSSDEWLYLASGVPGSAVPNKREEFAKQKLLGQRVAKNIEIVSTTKVEVDGLPGCEVVAQADHAESDDGLVFFAVVLYAESCHYVLFGRAGVDWEEEALAAFRASSKTFKREPVKKD